MKKYVKNNKKCNQVELSNNAAGQVGYCENCDVVELEIGSISMRIVAADLSVLSQLLVDADAQLHHYQHASEFDAQMSQSVIKQIH